MLYKIIKYFPENKLVPMQFTDSYTCFYHRLFENDRPVMPDNYSPAETSQSGVICHSPNSAIHKDQHHDDELVGTYINLYAFYRRTSIGLFTIVYTGLGIDAIKLIRKLVNTEVLL